MKLYRAVIEDNKDIGEIARVRVRIIGIHTENNENGTDDFNFIPTSQLPLAEIVGGLSFALIGGVGTSSIPRNGTWVWVVLEDDNPNKPVVIGTCIGNNTVDPTGVYNSGKGFVDPDGVYPFPSRSAESDINRLATGKKLSDPYYETAPNLAGGTATIHDTINNNIDDQAGITDGVSGADVSQTEPNSLNDLSKYPDNNVIETPSGHVVEFDDTPTNERVRLYHRTGSYIEVRPDGTFVQKSVNTDSANHYIHLSDVNEHIAKNVKKYIEGSLDEIVNLAVKRNLKHNLDEHVEGGVHETIDMDVFKNIAGYFKITASGNLEIINDVKITGGLEVTGDVTAAGNVSSKAEVADASGNLSSLRDEHDKNVGIYNAHTHIGNAGIPTAVPDKSENNDPKVRWGDFTWVKTALGFK